MQTIAQHIKNTSANYRDALLLADQVAINHEQDFENETTILIFEDDSKLKFDGVAQSIEQI